MKKEDILKDLPKKLKNVRAFDRIEKKLNAVLKTDHSHKTVKEYLTCAWCQAKFQTRQAMMKELGFKSIEQYSRWREVVGIMKKVAQYKHDHKE